MELNETLALVESSCEKLENERIPRNVIKENTFFIGHRIYTMQSALYD